MEKGGGHAGTAERGAGGQCGEDWGLGGAFGVGQFRFQFWPGGDMIRAGAG